MDTCGKEDAEYLIPMINGKLYEDGIYNNVCNVFEVGDKMKLNAYLYWPITSQKITDSNNIVTENLSWSSSNENVATIDRNTGELEIIAKGQTTISVSYMFVGATEYIDSFVLRAIDNTQSKEAEGVKLINNSQTGKIELTVNSTGMEKTLAGFSADIMIDKEQDFTIVSKTNGWKVETQNFVNGILSIIVEPSDEILKNITENNVETTNITVEMGFSTIVGKKMVSIRPDKLVRTDVNNSVNKPLIEYNETINGPFGVFYISESAQLQEVPISVTVKEGKENQVKIVGNTIYAKLNGHQHDLINDFRYPQAFFGDLLDCLNIKDEYEVLAYNGENLAFSGPDDELMYINKVTKVKFIGTDESYIDYNFVELGDICKNDNNQIDIHDVVYLRLAIVGSFNEKDGYPSSFVHEATDTDISNVTSERRELGDVGDVIAIRQRILNNKWNDIK